MTRAWIPRIAIATVFTGLLATGSAFLAPSPAAAEDAPKNLKVLPSTMSRSDIKKLMKKVATSIGEQCEYCHDTDDFAKDTEKKEIGRAMMKMTGELNKTYFKGEQRVGCITCHNGKAEPRKP